MFLRMLVHAGGGRLLCQVLCERDRAARVRGAHLLQGAPRAPFTGVIV